MATIKVCDICEEIIPVLNEFECCSNALMGDQISVKTYKMTPFQVKTDLDLCATCQGKILNFIQDLRSEQLRKKEDE